MVIYPKDVFEKLEFDKILLLTQSECLGSLAASELESIEPSMDLKLVQRMLTEVSEYVASFDRNDQIPLSNYIDITSDVKMLRKEGYVLNIDSIKNIYQLISIANELHKYFDSIQRQKLSPNIYSIFAGGYGIDSDINAMIDNILDEDGEVRPDASEELLKIHRKIVSKEKELQSLYGKIIHTFKTRGLLTDTVESMRNGRRVLTVPAENKRKIGGIIHDESATGKTVFIEPSEVIPVNNEIYNLYTERKKEIYKVIQALCNDLRPHADQFLQLQSTIVRLDIIRSKCRIAQKLEGHQPIVIGKPCFGIKNGYNPILKLKFKQEERVVVPFDLELLKNNRILIVSGPNAGGKSVVLKSAGLLQVMLQCGFLIPVDPNSKMGVFNSIFVDIGDQQSLEDDLSTYSSHLQNLKHFTENADEHSLILIDEFGSGTDPKIGGAIAESVLRKLNHTKVHAVITTHYSNLKYYAFKTRGIVNASMEFDQAALLPTFQLKIGKPGSSFAYEIATKTGLDKDIIKYAKFKTGKNEKAVDELLIKLQVEKKETEEKMEKVLAKEDKLNKLIKNYENLHRELEFRRKKLKLTNKEQMLAQLNADNRDLQKVVRELKESQKLEEAKNLAEQVKKDKLETIKAIQDLKEEVYYREDIDVGKIEVGGFVKMRTGDTSGEVLSLKNGVAEVQMGIMKVTIPIRELVPAKEPIELRSRSVNTHLSTSREGVRTKLDVRGYTPIDTRQLVEEFVDTALMHSVSRLTIVHGRGNGVLRKVVHEKLKEYKDVKSVTHPEEEFGGQSITFVSL
jgi:DNA mismatch repair protein MutS2